MSLTVSSEGFVGLRQWAEPVIFDRLSAAYRKLVKNDAAAGRLTRLHAPVWRALISGDAPGAEAHRRLLVAALRAAGLTPTHLAKVDADILTELLEIVGSRYQRSHRAATAYRLVLMELAETLRPRRGAVAA